MNRISFILMAVCLFLLCQQSFVFADRCDDVVAEAKKSFAAAKAAAKQKEYDEAAELYEEAEDYYRQVSEMRNCKCPKIAGTSKNNMETSRNNAARMREASENQENYDTYKQAVMKFNEGNAHVRNQEWEQAISAFEEAEELMESIASKETEIGQKAIQGAKKARKLADKAEERMEE